MNHPVVSPQFSSGPGEVEWTVSHHACVISTQAIAGDLPAWSAVWAEEQTAGRGQGERSFVSSPGGLYLTAVLPFGGDALAARGFALAVGWALCTALHENNLPHVRLRWPNDLMIGSAKVGGILVEQGGPHTLLVGVGLNLANRPWEDDSTLLGVTGRLADAFHGDVATEPAEWVPLILQAIRFAHYEFDRLRLEGFASRLDSCWDGAREVALSPARGVSLPATSGLFLGIDTHGAVRLCTAPGVEARIPAHHIERLREADR